MKSDLYGMAAAASYDAAGALQRQWPSRAAYIELVSVRPDFRASVDAIASLYQQVTAIPMAVVMCPVCHKTTGVEMVARPSVETGSVLDDEDPPTEWATHAPGPEATIVFSCSHVLTGTDGVAWLEGSIENPTT